MVATVSCWMPVPLAAHAWILVPPSFSSSLVKRSVLARSSSSSSVEPTTSTTNDNKDDDTTLYDALFQGGDATVEAPLPPAYTACPFSGILAGPTSFYRQASAALQAPTAFSFVSKRNQPPMVEVCEGRAIRHVLRQEFDTLTSNVVAGVSQVICGTQSLRTIASRPDHQAVRHLVSVPLSKPAVHQALPQLQAIGEGRLHEYFGTSSSSATTSTTNTTTTVRMGDVALSLATDVTRQVILGWTDDDKAKTHELNDQIATWLHGMWYPPGSAELNATLHAKAYLEGVLEQKLNDLEQLGHSDGSVVGGMLYATTTTDKDDDPESASTHHQQQQQHQTLTRTQVIHNTLLLILAGTETTSSSLANVMLCMGLHPDLWQRLVDEQAAVVAQHGTAVTPAALQDSPWLQAVVWETLRILPVTLVSRRVTQETLVVPASHTDNDNDKKDDSFHIPPGWGVSYNIYLAHQNDPMWNNNDGTTNCMDLETGFCPERWLHFENEKDPTRPPTVTPPTVQTHANYLGFGYGPRHCPGSFLAVTELSVFTALAARAIPTFCLASPVFSTNTDDKDPRPLDERIEWHKVGAMLTPVDKVPIVVPASNQL